jgi:hypothetical protein
MDMVIQVYEWVMGWAVLTDASPHALCCFLKRSSRLEHWS